MEYLSPEEHQKAVARYLKNMDRTIEAMLARREREREHDHYTGFQENAVPGSALRQPEHA